MTPPHPADDRDIDDEQDADATNAIELLIAEIEAASGTDGGYDDRVLRLNEAIRQHVI